MNEASSDARMLAAVLAEEARTGDAHPELDDLVDYHAGRLEPEDEERVRDHLVGCRACARALIELEPLVEPEAVDLKVVDLEARVALRELERRVAGERRGAIPALVYGTAAACLVAAAGLALWVVDLRRELNRPRINVAVEYLDAAELRDVATPAYQLPGGQTAWVLGLFPEDPLRRLPEYEVVLLDGAGREIWRERGLVLNDADAVTLLIPRRWIAPAKPYRIELYGLDDGRTLEGAYPLRGPPE